MHVKKGDNVIVLSGADKGKKGSVVRVFPALGKVIVEGVNMKKKSQRATKKTGKGQVVELAMPIDASNVKKVK